MSVIDQNAATEIPVLTNNTVNYLGVNIDHLLRLNEHHRIQLNKAKEVYRKHYNLFYSKGLQPKAKIICYQLSIRLIITYSAPLWWNTGPSVIEKNSGGSKEIA